MTGNKYLLADRSKLLKTRLERLGKELQGSLESSKLQTKEAYLFEAVKTITEFYKLLKEPKTQIKDIFVDDYPSSELFNKLWDDLLDDLIVIFTELENIESLTISNFNFANTDANRLIGRMKSVSSKLGDYILYAINTLKDSIYFKDSFNDISKIEVNSKLLNKEQCDINQAEGIITLPIDKTKDPSVIAKAVPVINPNSNGVMGNLQELNAVWNGNLSAILDSNPDTWFEYEYVTTKTDDENDRLILDLTINLGDEQVINHIRVNPNNFGTKTTITIDEIETSTDGQIFTSIKDDIPIGGFTTEDEENIFILAPSTCKYAGQGVYTFLPRKAKYVHFVFRQEEPYIISTASGDKNRYAIGIRDIEIQGLTFLSNGELISNAFESVDEIRKIIMRVNQNPSISDLAEIKYYISPDNGSTWHEIIPENIGTGQIFRYLDEDAQNESVAVERIYELLNFNSSDSNSIQTSSPVYSLRVKVTMARNDDAFKDGSYTFQEEVLVSSELHSIPGNAPYVITLAYSPVEGSIIIVDPMYGSRGDETSPYIIGHATDSGEQRKFLLPFSSLPRPVEKVWDGNKWDTRPISASDWVHVKVGGEEWTQATQLLSLYNADWTIPSSVAKVYHLELGKGELTFGDNFSSLAPPANTRIELYFDEEKLFPSETEDYHVAKLDFNTSSNKDSMIITRYEEISEEVEMLPMKETVLELKHGYITDYTGIQDVLGSAYEKTYINGKEEFSASTDWSIDTEKGVLYLRTPTSYTQDTTLSYLYQPKYELKKTEWGWANTTTLRDSVYIKEDAWKTISKRESIYMENTAFAFDLSQLSIEKGTLSFELTETATGDEIATDSQYYPFLKEVDYIDGRKEFGIAAIQTVQNVPVLESGLQSFMLDERINTSSRYKILFSNKTLFATNVTPAVPTSHGEYSINYGNGYDAYVQLYIGTVPLDFGTITYYYVNSNYEDTGLYSVNYRTGKVFTQRQMYATWTCIANYEYSDFRAKYRIARLLNKNDYKVDVTKNTITFKDEEILKRAFMPHKRLDGKTHQYLINYDYVYKTRKDIAGLKDYFSPIVKDYMLKILTKGRIF